MNTGFTSPTNHARARMLAFLGQNAHFQLSAHHSVFILSTTLPRLNSSSVHLLGLSILNILQCYYLSFSLCVCVIFKDISIDKRSNILLFSGGYQSIIGGKSRGSMLSSAMAASKTARCTLYFRRYCIFCPRHVLNQKDLHIFVKCLVQLSNFHNLLLFQFN